MQDLIVSQGTQRDRLVVEALARFGFANFTIDSGVRRQAERCVNAALEAVKSHGTATVVSWACEAQQDFERLQIRELLHATCMAIAAEVAHNFRASFREVMASLHRAETDVARALRRPILGPVAEAA